MLFLGIDILDNIFIVSLMDENKTVKGLFKFYKEGLLWFIDHNNPNVISINYDFCVKSKAADTNKSLSNLYKIIQNEFGYSEVNKQTFKEKEKKILKSDVDEFWKKIIRKDILPSDTVEGLEQRLYNLPKTGIKINKKLLSTDKKYIAKEIDSVVLSFAAYSYYNNRFEHMETESGVIIIPKYIYIMKKDREKKEES